MRKYQLIKERILLMGQHKYNPIAIAAKSGKLPPKPRRSSKRELERLVYAKYSELLVNPLADVRNMFKGV